jgi:hypothetical protein
MLAILKEKRKRRFFGNTAQFSRRLVTEKRFGDKTSPLLFTTPGSQRTKIVSSAIVENFRWKTQNTFSDTIFCIENIKTSQFS